VEDAAGVGFFDAGIEADAGFDSHALLEECGRDDSGDVFIFGR
jgi:hypothetical protein